MLALLRQFLILIITIAFWGTIVDCLSFQAGIDADRLDTHRACVVGEGRGRDCDAFLPAVKSIYKNRWESCLAGMYMLRRTDNPKMIIMGSSSTEQGFRPENMAPLFPEYEIHNISMSYMPICETRTIINAALASMKPETLRKSVFVLGIWYNSFVRNEMVSTVIPQSQYGMRPYLYTTNNGAPQAIFNDRQTVWILRAFRALYFMRYVDGVCEEAASSFGHDVASRLGVGVPISRDDNQPDALWPAKRIADTTDDPGPGTSGEKMRNWDFAHDYWEGPYWKLGMQASQFEILMDICDSIHCTGASLVLVDLPVSTLHRTRLEFAEYQQAKKPWLDRAAANFSARYIDLEELCPDYMFYDFTHPRYGVRPIWSYYLWVNWDKTRQLHAIQDERELASQNSNPPNFNGLSLYYFLYSLPEPILKRVLKRKPLIVEEIRATSSSAGCLPEYALGTDKSHEWALKGSSGSLLVKLGTSTTAGGICVRPRVLSPDPIASGRVRINGSETFEIKNLQSPNSLFITFTQPLTIKTIEIIIDPGDSRFNPGISEMWMFD